MNCLEFRNVEKIFAGPPSVHAVKGVSFALKQGAFAALMGPSGSGKTTLLNLASGLDRPTRGQVFISNAEISALTQEQLCIFRRENLGFVFQAYNLFPTLSSLENVAYTGVIRGDSRAESYERAHAALDQVGMSDKIHVRPHQLSGGQSQRVAVARAIATHPKLIFADEPTANLDSDNAFSLIELFENLNRALGITFLFSTHDLRLVSRVKKVFQMRDGYLLPQAAQPSAEAFLNAPV